MSKSAASESTQKIQLLGLAFAGSEFMFEVDMEGQIQFALGSSHQFTGFYLKEISAKSWFDLIAPDDHPLLLALSSGLKPGERQPSIRVTLRRNHEDGAARHASLSAIRLPQTPLRLSCALTTCVETRFAASPREETGLLATDTFVDVSQAIIRDATDAGQLARLTLVQLEGFETALNAMPRDDAIAVRKDLSAALRLESYGGAGATKVATDRYALLRSENSAANRVIEHSQRVCGPSVKPTSQDVRLVGENVQQNVLALNTALNSFREEGPEAAIASFEGVLRDTSQAAALFRDALQCRRFELVFQPIVSLHGNVAHHFESVVQVGGQEGEAEVSRLMHETAYILDFELAITRIVLRSMAQMAKNTRIAISLSARSIQRADFIGAFLGLVAAAPTAKGRLIVEIKDIQEIVELGGVKSAIQRLHEENLKVCLRDFRRLAPTLDYVRHLDIDYLKLGVNFVRDSRGQAKDHVLVRHVAALCRDLKIATIAEGIETGGELEKIRNLGLDFAQGPVFGKSTPSPIWTPRIPASVTALHKSAIEESL